ncbi:MAG: ParB N-terminal domain-containing protein [Paludibacter sp.]|nr:ParB N-terminal domain-containing protein [Paludibacter sp.]
MQTKTVFLQKTTIDVPLDKIDPDDWLHDRREDELGLDPQLFELIGSIDRRGGLIHPIFLIRKRDGRYKIGAGKRRYTAYTMLQERYKDINPDMYNRISATVVDVEEISKQEMIAIAIEENSARKAVWKIGVINAIFSGIAELSGSIEESDDEDIIIQKGRNIFWFYYRMYVMQDKTERKNNLPCTHEAAILAVNSFLEATGLNAATIARKSSVTKMPAVYTEAMAAGLISHTFAIRDLAKLSKTLDKQNSMIATIKEIMDRKDLDKQTAKKMINEHFNVLLKPKVKGQLPKKTINFFKKKTSGIVDAISKLPKDDPMLQQIREQLASIEKLLQTSHKGKQ